ncbi:MAG: acyltransferase, partial [Rhodocyclales bacterium]|nr:acyltransferase [Rhodocyclales bacterium]
MSHSESDHEWPLDAAGIPAQMSVKKSEFNPAVNGFRGFCALMVFVFHVFNAGIVPWPNGSPLADAFTYVVGSLRYGVELFFMISGYVIVGSLTRHANIAAFFRDRATRIFSLWVPLHIGICAAGTLWGWKVFPYVADAQAWWQVFVANLLLIT